MDVSVLPSTVCYYTLKLMHVIMGEGGLLIFKSVVASVHGLSSTVSYLYGHYGFR